ncbi:hypothetical protein KKH39_04365 [Patescibacteria group bacterium]|nr:hypothetical protein [Patescibacteria group bacterium]
MQASAAIFNQLLDTLGVPSRQRPLNNEQAERLGMQLVHVWQKNSKLLAAAHRNLPASRHEAGRLARMNGDHCHHLATAMVAKMDQIAPDNDPILSSVVRSLNESLAHNQASA